MEKTTKKQPAIIKEFTEFINRGNVVDLAVGVIIGAAFGKIVTSLVNDIIMPVVGVILGGVNFSALEITIPNFFGSGDAAHIAYGNFLQNIVDFLIVAICVFIFVKFINKISRKKDAKAEKKEEAAATEQDEMLEVLKDIRKELRKK